MALNWQEWKKKKFKAPEAKALAAMARRLEKMDWELLTMVEENGWTTRARRGLFDVRDILAEEAERRERALVV